MRQDTFYESILKPAYSRLRQITVVAEGLKAIPDFKDMPARLEVGRHLRGAEETVTILEKVFKERCGCSIEEYRVIQLGLEIERQCPSDGGCSQDDYTDTPLLVFFRRKKKLPSP